MCCPNCGARPEDGTEFLVIERYRGERVGIIEGINEDGELIPSFLGSEILGLNEIRTIVCKKCQHEWGTKRRISSVWE